MDRERLTLAPVIVSPYIRRHREKVIIVDAHDFIETADPREALAARMIRKGASISETCRQAFGSKGGKQSRVIKGIREKFGI